MLPLHCGQFRTAGLHNEQHARCAQGKNNRLASLSLQTLHSLDSFRVLFICLNCSKFSSADSNSLSSTLTFGKTSLTPFLFFTYFRHTPSGFLFVIKGIILNNLFLLRSSAVWSRCHYYHRILFYYHSILFYYHRILFLGLLLASLSSQDLCECFHL